MKINQSLLHGILAAAALLSSPACAYDVTISGGTTTNMAFAGGAYHPTGAGAVLNYLDLQTQLASGDVDVRTGTHGTENGDIIVAHRLTWAANTLNLDAFHSIVFNKRVLPTAASAFELVTNDGGSGGDLVFGGGVSGSIAFDNTTQSLKINTVPYALVDSLSLLATDISGNPSGNFAFAHNETETHVFTNAVVTTNFNGNFEGLGNTITGMAIHNNSGNNAIALFAQTLSLSTVKDFTLAGVDLQGTWSGGPKIAGVSLFNSGLISNVTVSGTLQNASTVWPVDIAGLVVTNASTGKIVAGRSTATITAADTSHAAGLVVTNAGIVTDSSATGDITSTGTSTTQTLGGLVAVNNASSSITLSLAKGNVAAKGGVLGGLVGTNNGVVSESFALGALDSTGGTATDGGFAGVNTGAITDCYAKGDGVAQNGSTMGGFVGHASSTSAIATSYSNGGAAGGTSIGGFIGVNDLDMTVTSSYWNTTTSGLSQATSNGRDSGITGLTTAQMRSALPAGFSASIWALSSTVNNGFPYLIDNPPG